MPQAWCSQMKTFTIDEFSDIKDSSDNTVRDGALIKAIDDLAAFVEVYLSLKNGIQNEDMEGAKFSLIEKYKAKEISGINFGQIYAEFD